MTVNHTITRDEVEIEITCEVKMWGGAKGARDSFGVPLEPDDEPEAEIISVTPDIELTEDEECAIREKAFDQAADEANDFEE